MLRDIRIQHLRYDIFYELLRFQIIGGEIFCNQGDGFTQSLEFPMKASQ